jgi:hypothetical protein
LPYFSLGELSPAGGGGRRPGVESPDSTKPILAGAMVRKIRYVNNAKIAKKIYSGRCLASDMSKTGREKIN